MHCCCCCCCCALALDQLWKDAGRIVGDAWRLQDAAAASISAGHGVGHGAGFVLVAVLIAVLVAVLVAGGDGSAFCSLFFLGSDQRRRIVRMRRKAGKDVL